MFWVGNKSIYAGAALFLLGVLLTPSDALAEVRFEELPGLEVYNDFVVGPGKIELQMQPGQTQTVEIKVSNRLGDPRDFRIEVEDFSGSQSADRPVVLYGTGRGPYSLRDYIYPETNILEIDHAKRAVIPVTVSIPEDAEPGGLYGSVLISVASPANAAGSQGQVGAGAAIISRIGVLFFVRIAGEVNEEARMIDFTTKNDQTIFTKGPVPFEVNFENSGSVHVNPYGVISVKNMLGQTIGEQPIDPWFMLPGSVRSREISWDRPLLIGKYTATVELNRGYDDIIDTGSVSVWVIPVKLLVGILLGLIILFVLLRFIFTKIEIRVK